VGCVTGDVGREGRYDIERGRKEKEKDREREG
jgi:hypothetical protein